MNFIEEEFKPCSIEQGQVVLWGVLYFEPESTSIIAQWLVFGSLSQSDTS